MKNTSSMYNQELAQAKMFVADLTGGERKLRLCDYCNGFDTASSEMVKGRLQYFRDAIREIIDVKI